MEWDNGNKVEINANGSLQVINANGSLQVINADGSATVYATQNNDSANIKEKNFQNNKKEDYIKNWNSRLFLHQDNDQRPITLADIFIMPKYNYHIKAGRIKFSDKDTMVIFIEKFI